MRVSELVTEVAAALDEAAAAARERGFDVRASATLPVQLRYRRDTGIDVLPLRARRFGRARAAAVKLVIKR
jgi:hypothetical protein